MCVGVGVRVVVLFIVLAILFSSLLLSMLSGSVYNYRVRECSVIVLSIDVSANRFFRNTCFYTLDSSSLGYTYRARYIIVITHSAHLPDGRTIIALNEEPDFFTVYAIDVGDRMYKAILLSDLAKHLSADTIVLVGCLLNGSQVYTAFYMRARKVYFYKCNASLSLVLDDLYRIISGYEPVDKCFDVITYGYESIEER